MNADFRADVELAIERATGRAASIVETTPLDGGCINHASRIGLADGRVYCLKWNPSPLPHLFEREAEGLAALHDAGTIAVPAPVCVSASLERPAAHPFIVLDYIKTGKRSPDFFADFGRQFADLHQSTRAERFGFSHDNYLGSTPQRNAWNDSWVAFWRENRLGLQLDLARRNGLADTRFNRLGDALLGRLDEYLADPDEPPCLLHGDLWRGNYLANEEGDPALIDPAAYYGRREADLAMPLLFGGFKPEFYWAYEEIEPLADGSDVRIDLYKLYHLLNHLNLFGSSYRSGCMAILRRYA